MNQKDIDRFLSKIDKTSNTNGCWVYTGRKDRDGYGRFDVGGKIVGAHRYMLEISGIQVPTNKVVCHKCDNPSCVNPAHLFVGTQRDNVLDMYSKGRWVQKERWVQKGRPTIKDTSKKNLFSTPNGVFQNIHEVCKHYNIHKDTAYGWFAKEKPGFTKIKRDK